MALSIPVVWSDDSPAARARRRDLGRRQDTGGETARACGGDPRGARRRRAPRSSPPSATTTRRSRPCTTGALLAFLASAWKDWEAAGLPEDPGPGSRRPVHLPAPGPGRRARAPRARRDVGAPGGVLLRHDDADRAGNVGGRAGSGRRSAHRRRPRLGWTAGRLRVLPPARSSRHAVGVRRLLLPEQRCDRGRSGSASSAPPASASSTSTRITETAPSRSSGSASDVFTGSVHVDPETGWFPHFLGTAAERGVGAGTGANLQRAAAAGCGRRRLARAASPRSCRRPEQRRRGARPRARRRCRGRRPREPAAGDDGRLSGSRADRRQPRAAVRRRTGRRLRSRLDRRARPRNPGRTRRAMPEPLPVWIGKDEHGGIPRPARVDLKPPPHWRLEAVVATERPRSPAVSPDGRSRRLHPGSRHVRPLAARPRRRRAPAAHDRPRSAAVLGGHAAGLLARRDARSRTPTTAGSASCPTGGRPAAARRRGRKPRRGSATTGSSSRSSATAATASPSSRVAEAWPQRLAREHGDLDTHGDEQGAIVSPDGSTVAYVFVPHSDYSRYEMRVVDVADGTVRALTGAPGIRDHVLDWSPDGYDARGRLGAQRLVRAPPRRRRRQRRAPADDGERGLPRGTLASGRQPARRDPGKSAAASISSPSTRRTATVTDLAAGRRLGRACVDGGRAHPRELREPDRAPRAPARRRGSGAGSDPRTGAARDHERAARRREGVDLHDVRRPRDPGVPLPAVDGLGRAPGTGSRLPARRPGRLLRRRVGRPCAVLRRQGVCVVRDQLPRLDRARKRLRARQPRRLGGRRHEGLPRRGGLPPHRRLGRRRPARDLRLELRLVHGAARGHRRPRVPVPLRDLQVRRLRRPHHVGSGGSRGRADADADHGASEREPGGVPRRRRPCIGSMRSRRRSSSPTATPTGGCRSSSRPSSWPSSRGSARPTSTSPTRPRATAFCASGRSSTSTDDWRDSSTGT